MGGPTCATALELAHRYANLQPDLADLCLIRMSEFYPRNAIVPVDEEDCGIYRRDKRETTPILCLRSRRWPR